MAETTPSYSERLAAYELGDMVAEYVLATATQAIGLILYPKALAGQVAARREYLDSPEILLIPGSGPTSVRAWNVDSLVQFKVLGDATNGYLQGLTMRNSNSLADLHYKSQKVKESAEGIEIRTRLKSTRGYVCDHLLTWHRGDPALTIQTIFHNRSGDPVSLEMLASFSLGGITPFARDDAPGRLFLHRFRSYWAAEGRPVVRANRRPGPGALVVRACRPF